MFKYTQHERLISEVLETPQKLIMPTDMNPTYSANDMRLFHHYLVEAYPSIPVAYDSVWTKDIPAFSHQVSVRALDINIRT